MESQNPRAENGVEVILDKRLDRESRLARLRSAYNRSRNPSLLEALEQAVKYPGPPPTYPALRKYVDGQATEQTSADSIQMIFEWNRKWPDIDRAPDDEDFIGTLEKQLVEQNIDLKYNMLAPFFEEAHKLRMQDICWRFTTTFMRLNLGLVVETIDKGLQARPVLTENEVGASVVSIKTAVKSAIGKFDYYDNVHEYYINKYILDGPLRLIWDMAIQGGANGDTLKKAIQSALSYALLQTKAKLSELREILIDISEEDDDGSK